MDNQDKQIVGVKDVEQRPKKKGKIKKIADASLITMGVGFIATTPINEEWYGKLCQGFFEAGLVGGLADLFAVTALFKHPFNIKIPYTAILPTNRKKLTKGILTMVENELLNKETIREKLSGINFTELGLEKADDYAKGEKFKDTVSGIQTEIVNKIVSYDTRQLEEMVVKVIKEKEGTIKSEVVVDLILNKAISNDYDKKGIDKLLEYAGNKTQEEEVKNNITEFVIKLIEKKASESNGIMKMGLMSVVSVGKEKIGNLVNNAIQDSITNLKDRDNEGRQKLESVVREEMVKIIKGEELLSTIEEKRKKVLNEDVYRKTVQKGVEVLKGKVISYIGSEQFLNIVQKGVIGYIGKIKEDDKKKAKIEGNIQGKIIEVLEKNHKQIGKIIEEKLNKLSNEEITALIENKVGNEMAGIRINGAICGGLIGLCLTGIKMGMGAYI